MRVLICGLPGSGNRLIREHATRSGAEAVVTHPVQSSWNPGAYDVAIVPIRLDDEHRRIRRQGGTGADEMFPYPESRQVVARIPIPTYPIFYEQIQRTGGKALDDLFRWIGLEPAPWPEDEDRTMHKGRVLTERERRIKRGQD